MQGSRTPTLTVITTAAAAVVVLGGCIVHNHPPAPPPNQQQQPPPPSAPQALAIQSAKPAPAPATRPVIAPPPPQKAAPAPTTPQPAAAARTYTIKPGDNLWNISKEVYGDGTKYQRIVDANPGLNPDNMKPGTRIVIP
jgi:nucleoid-associated protein YgaU